MTVQPLNEEAIFHAARAIASPAERANYLAQACGDNQALRFRVEGLLKVYAEETSFAGIPSEVLATIDHQPITERPGTVIGPYKLMEQIGEGGFGLVFVAEQHQPVRRKVALKVIKPGMDTRDVIARFEAERQALALMDHPNIARVFDAGATGSGRPYFVMELVRGVPITEYCDQQHLTPRQRLELFVSLCNAIQHAHQKGIIHRDVKPTNVLVTEHDGRPVVKVIDFGVAKALSQQLTQHTIYTQFAQMIGTPLYMSPEQAAMGGLDIDTRSDIYSLGVLLYELLTGSTPFDRKRLQEAAVDEIRRLICEEEPPKPSTRLSHSGDRLPSIAELRNTEPAGLSKLVCGDLDWIVMKCLEKDRNRRYETANGLAMDIQRHLDDEPVSACPPSAAYRFRKFARRNKGALFIASSAVAILLVLVTGLAISNRMIAAQRQRAETNFARARVAVRNILSQAALGKGEWSELPASLRKKFADEAIEFYQSFLQEDSSDRSLQYETAVSYRALSELYRSIGESDQAEKFARQSTTILEDLASQHPNIIEYRQQLAYSRLAHGQLLRQANDLAGAEAAYRKSFEVYGALISQSPVKTEFYQEFTNSFIALSSLLTDRGARQEAEGFTKRILELIAIQSQFNTSRQQLAENYLSLASRLTNSKNEEDALTAADLAVKTAEQLAELPDSAEYQQLLGTCLRQRGAIYRDMKRNQEAEDDLSRAAEIFKGLTSRFPQVAEYGIGLARCYRNLGVLKRYTGDLRDSEKAYREAVRLQPDDALTQNGFGNLLWERGKLPEAEVAYREAFRLKPNSGYRFNVANVLAAQEKFIEAEAEYREIIRVLPQDSYTHYRLGNALAAHGKLKDAEVAYRDAIRLTPHNAFYRLDLARVLVEQSKFTEADAEFREILDSTPRDGDTCNRLAWSLATFPQSALRRSPQAVDLAQKAVNLAKKGVDLAPKDGNVWNTLGVAQYRAGQWKPAIEAIGKSMELRGGGDAVDRFFLSMAHWQLGHKEEARTWYDKAVEWMDKNQLKDKELIAFRTEAADLLGILRAESSAHAVTPEQEPNKDNPTAPSPQMSNLEPEIQPAHPEP